MKCLADGERLDMAYWLTRKETPIGEAHVSVTWGRDISIPKSHGLVLTQAPLVFTSFTPVIEII